MATSPSAARRRTGKPSATSLSADQSSSQTRKGCARAPASPRASRLSRLAAWKRPAGRVGQGEVGEIELARRSTRMRRAAEAPRSGGASAVRKNVS